MANKRRQVSNMKEENATDKIEEYTKSQKASFRRRQRELPFTEKMQIAFALAKRDQTIRRAVLLPKQKKEDK
jgi:ribosomal protein L1